MSKFESEYLSKREIKGIQKLGNVLIPKNEKLGLPSFKESNCINFVDIAVKNLEERDFNDLKLFLKIASILPGFMIKLVIKVLEGQYFALLRMGNIGIKGIVYSLYYSDKSEHDGEKIYEKIGATINIVR